MVINLCAIPSALPSSELTTPYNSQSEMLKTEDLPILSLKPVRDSQVHLDCTFSAGVGVLLAVILL